MDIKDLKGVGPVLEKKLNGLNIFNVTDLLEYYPYRYNNYNIVSIEDLEDSSNGIIEAIVVSQAKVSYFNKMNRLSFDAISNDILLHVTIFNRKFLYNLITPNKKVFLIGKYEKLKSRFIASDIKFNLEDNSLEPVYHLGGTIKNKEIEKIMESAISCYKLEENLPDNIVNNYGFINKNDAIKLIHQPKSLDDINIATKRLKYEELFNYMFKINYLKDINNKTEGIKRCLKEEDLNKFFNSLPFKLTNDQIKAIKDILNDMNTSVRMNRLVLGDVGSGKTMVAAASIYLNYISGYSSALMAPTEILAFQHFSGLKKELEPLGLKVALLVGTMTKKEKDLVLEDLKNGNIDLIIGTHALLSPNVKFNNLGLVVTDEQHRFGVNQRLTLNEKGIYPDVLYLSATPIPRTYALTIYGDLDISIIKEKPNGRKDIITKVIKEKDIKEVLIKILDELKEGHQVFVVSPLIEDNESVDELKSVLKLKENFSSAFQNKVNVEIIHGKMKKEEKDQVMDDFKKGIIKILISTTVIEVGIDIPNATIMVIYNSERFGLATLHQLRGRVGRNDLQSYCFLIANKEKERLKVMEETNDGFKIAEADYMLRGEGDIFGVRQHGGVELKVADLKNDYELLLQAKKDSKEYIESKKYLDNNYYKNIIRDISFIN